jgi:hypothetical protein
MGKSIILGEEFYKQKSEKIYEVKRNTLIYFITISKKNGCTHMGFPYMRELPENGFIIRINFKYLVCSKMGCGLLKENEIDNSNLNDYKIFMDDGTYITSAETNGEIIIIKSNSQSYLEFISDTIIIYLKHYYVTPVIVDILY